MRSTTVFKTALSLALLVVLSLQFTVSAYPQQTLADADWFERDLGDGVVWRYYLFESLFGSRQSLAYIDVDLNNPSVTVDFPYLQTGRQLTSSMIQEQFSNSVSGINGTYFNTATGGHRTYLRVNGTVIPPAGDLFSPWGYEGALALDASANASIQQMPAGGWSLNSVHPDIFACGPLLVIEDVIPTAHFNSIGSHCTARHPRSAVGITAANHLILVTADGRTDMAYGMSCDELAQVMQQLGCSDALNLDGGGSTTLWGAGEMFNGVLNYPSDNGLFDHRGERACSNAIAIAAAPPSPKAWDGRLTSKVYSMNMQIESQQTVTLIYENIGTSTWTAEDTRLILARPETRVSELMDSDTWISPSQPALMTPSEVVTGATATFSFVLKAPLIEADAQYLEHFMLTQAGVGRIGPADSEAFMRFVVQTPVAPGETFLVESRPGGRNSGWYSDSGMADTSANCTAPGCTANIGMRYGSTYQSVAGLKNATVAPDFPEAASYKVYVAWGAGSSRRSPVTYHVNHSKGKDTFQIDQSAQANVWVQLGTEPYLFNKGFGGSVVMTNEDIDVSGSMYAGAVKFEFVPPEQSDQSYVVEYLGSAIPKPTIDGISSLSEWDAASPAATGYVRHDNPDIAAVEDGSFRMLFDDSHLYILFQMSNAHLQGFSTPPTPYSYYDLPGDRINFFFTPFGISDQRFYRILFCPNPADNQCYVWSQASLTKTTSAEVGTDWLAGGDVAYNYVSGVLTIEYRVSWTTFNYPEINVASVTEHGAIWGVQPCISNELSPGIWEHVNWEPDDTPSYVYGEPFGTLEFRKSASSTNAWEVY